MASSESWKDVLRAQHEDLARLEALDAALNENKISDDIDKLLKKPVRTELRSVSRTSEIAAPIPPTNGRRNSQIPPPALDDSMADDQQETPLSPSNTEEQILKKIQERAAPETADRFVTFLLIFETSMHKLCMYMNHRILRAKYSVMTKQLNAAVELRKKMEEQCRDQQHQLQTEREEKKSLQKRYFLFLLIIL